MRLVPVLALALLATAPVTAPAHANPSCLAAPTPDCVFQMAVDQALTRPKMTDVLQGLVETALVQEAAGRDDWADTLDRLPPVLRAAPDRGAFGLGEAMFGFALTNATNGGPYLVATTRIAAHLKRLLTKVAPILDLDDQADMFDLGQTGDLAAITDHLADHLRAAGPTLAETMAEAAAGGLINSGRVEDAFGLLGPVPSQALSGKISRMATLHMLETAGPAAAKALALRFADQGDRVDALFAVAHRWATTGHPDKAVAIARDLPPEVWLSKDRSDAWLLAEILATNGAASLVIKTTSSSSPKIIGPYRTLFQIEVTAAALTGDGPAAFAAVKGHHSSVRKDVLGNALQASWIIEGQAGADALLALLPPEDLPEALAALGLAQIATADLPAALATEARISAISRQHPALKALRKRLAPLLAAQGQAEKAVAMAHTLGMPSATAHGTAALDPIATD